MFLLRTLRRIHWPQTIKYAMYVERNIEMRSCIYCCSGKVVIITYFECEFVDLGIQHIMRMRHIVICGSPGSTVFLHIVS